MERHPHRHQKTQWAFHDHHPIIELQACHGDDDANSIDVFSAEPNVCRLLQSRDPSSIVRMDLIVDASIYSLTSLSYLNLSGSKVNSIRDLAGGIRSLTILSLVRCGLVDLDGISSCHHLSELYLAYNEIHDLTPIAFLENTLQVLDVEGNRLESTDAISGLSALASLSYLNLALNPISYDQSYRPSLCRLLSPSLMMLDDVSVDRLPKSSSPELRNEFDSILNRIRTSPLRSGHDRLPSLYEDFKATHSPRRRQHHQESLDLAACTSDLTMGDILCGSPILGLRARRESFRRYDHR